MRAHAASAGAGGAVVPGGIAAGIQAPCPVTLAPRDDRIKLGASGVFPGARSFTLLLLNHFRVTGIVPYTNVPGTVP